MNRSEKRNLIAKLQQKTKLGKQKLNAIVDYFGMGSGKFIPQQSIEEGERVMLNAPNIKSRPNYSIMSGAYKEFVENNTDTIFTAHVDKDNLVSFKEEPRWWFWSGDLIKIHEES